MERDHKMLALMSCNNKSRDFMPNPQFTVEIEEIYRGMVHAIDGWARWFDI